MSSAALLSIPHRVPKYLTFGPLKVPQQQDVPDVQACPFPSDVADQLTPRTVLRLQRHRGGEDDQQHQLLRDAVEAMILPRRHKYDVARDDRTIYFMLCFRRHRDSSG